MTNTTRTFKTKYQPPTGGTTEQEIFERFPALFVFRKPLARRVVQKKTYVDNGEIKTPFAIIGVRSANCTNKQREVIQK